MLERIIEAMFCKLQNDERDGDVAIFSSPLRGEETRINVRDLAQAAFQVMSAPR